MLVINCKNYMQVAGGGIGRLVDAAASAARRHGTSIAVAPPQHLLGSAAGGPVQVLAQHVDDAGAGSTTGFVVPELLRGSGVAGSLVNHSEHRVGPEAVPRLVRRLADLGMVSVVCARDVAEVRMYAAAGPDYVAIEPPELIGTGRAVSRERPGIISGAAEALAESGSRTRLLCGAGIASGEDVARAAELGAAGVLVASGIIGSDDWEGAISDLASRMPGAS